jgi:6-phosphogluconolactonase
MREKHITSAAMTALKNSKRLLKRLPKNSWLLVLAALSCGTIPSVLDASVKDSGGSALDSGVVDAGVDDAGMDASVPDDAGAGDAGTIDSGTGDAGTIDSGVGDAGLFDASVDAGLIDSGTRDAGFDAGSMMNPTTHVYVGSGNGTITHYVLTDAGALLFQQDITRGANASYLAFHPNKKFVYSINESAGEILSFSVSDAGVLAYINKVSSSGVGPAHIAVDVSGKFVSTANYGGGQVPVVRLDAGVLTTNSDLKSPGTNPHLVAFSPDNQFVFVPCKGSDFVAQYRFNQTTGVLTPNTPATVSTATGAGPRHLVISENQTRAYLVNELNNTVSSFSISTGGTLTLIDTKSTLPSGFAGSNTGAHIVLHPNQQLVFTSNRGHNSIAAFRVAANGTLTALGHTLTQGTTPRDFTLNPEGTVMLVANQGSFNVVSFAVNSSTGALTSLGFTTNINSPGFVGAMQW